MEFTDKHALLAILSCLGHGPHVSANTISKWRRKAVNAAALINTAGPGRVPVECGRDESVLTTAVEILDGSRSEWLAP